MSDDPTLQGILFQRDGAASEKGLWPSECVVRGAHRGYFGQRMEVSDVCVVAIIVTLRNPIYVLGWAVQ